MKKTVFEALREYKSTPETRATFKKTMKELNDRFEKENRFQRQRVNITYTDCS